MSELLKHFHGSPSHDARWARMSESAGPRTSGMADSFASSEMTPAFLGSHMNAFDSSTSETRRLERRLAGALSLSQSPHGIPDAAGQIVATRLRASRLAAEPQESIRLHPQTRPIQMLTRGMRRIAATTAFLLCASPNRVDASPSRQTCPGPRAAPRGRFVQSERSVRRASRIRTVDAR